MTRNFSQHTLLTPRPINFTWRILGAALLSFTLLLTAVGQAFAQPGDVDPTFNIGGGTIYYVYAVAIQTDGKIVIGGDFTDFNGVNVNRIARLNSDGSLDTTFNVGTGVNQTVRTIALQSDGKILVGGAFSTYNGVSAYGAVRLNSDGSRDTSFVAASSGINSTSKLAVQSDGKILHAGIDSNLYYKIVRLNSDGSLDNSFTPYAGTTVVTGTVIALTLAQQIDGKIIVSCGNPQACLVRLNTNGSLDANFSTNLDGRVHTIALQADGKILIGGFFNSYGGVSRNQLARLNSNGSLDTTFNPGTGTSGGVYSIVPQADGKILVGGFFSSYNGTASGGIVRINPDASLDTSFASSGTGSLNLVALQSDNKIITVGYSVPAYKRVSRLQGGVATTSVTVTSDANPSLAKLDVTFTATVTPALASGTVTFTLVNGSGTTNVTVNVVNGTATYVASRLPLGNTSVTATYNGDANYLGSTSPVYVQTVRTPCQSLNC